MNVRRSFVAHNSSYETCVVGRSLAMLLLPKSIKYALSVKYDESLGPTTPGIKHASLATLLRTKSTKYALSVKVQRSSVAHNSKYQTCEVLGLTTTVSNMRYRLKRFWGPDVLIGESLWPQLQVSNMRYLLKFGDAFAAPKYQICVIGECAAKFCGP